MKNARFWMLLIGLAVGSPGLRAEEAASSKPWAVQPIRAVEPPADPSGWSANAVDRFIRAKQRDHQLEPADPTDKRTLLRRVTLDVLGLPPTPEEIDAFLADSSADAWSKVVERLLASPRYGERWGRHWLDGFGVFYEEPPRGLIFLAASRAASATRRCGSCLSFSNSCRAACAVGPISPNAIAAWRRTAHSGS